MTQMNSSVKQTHRRTGRTRKLQTHRMDLWVPRGWLGVWDSQEQTIICRLDKQGPTVQDRDLYSVPRDKPK